LSNLYSNEIEEIAMHTETQTSDDYVTIIGGSMAEVMSQFKAQGLAEKRYAIVHRVGQHRFTYANGPEATQMFDGAPMVAATFKRG
jgi:hypothetical protein